MRILFYRIIKLISQFVTSPIVAIIVAGIGIRLLIAPYFSWTTDVALWENVMNDMFNGLTMYETRSYSYPPLWIYVLSPLFVLIEHIGLPTGSYSNIMADANMITPMAASYLTTPAFNLIVKLPLILADGAIAWLIYEIVLKTNRNRKLALWAAALWLFNPLSILITAILTQFDALAILATLLALRLYLSKNYFECGIAIMLGLLIKLYPLFLGCAFGALILRRAYDDYGLRPLKIVRPVVAYGLGTLITLVLFLPGLLGTEALEVIFRRTETSIIPQGVGIWFVTYVPAIREFVAEHNELLHRITFPLNFGIYGLCYLAPLISRRQFRVREIGYLITVILFVTVSFNDLAVAHYFSWAFPFLLLGIFTSSELSRTMLVMYGLIVFAGLAFMLAMWGFAFPALMYGFALNLNLIDPHSINAILFDWRSIPGLLNRYLFIDYMFVSAAICALASTRVVIYGFHRLFVNVYIPRPVVMPRRRSRSRYGVSNV